MTIRIKNWDKFQHYKGRQPPWIKVYIELLDDVEWFNLSGTDAKALVMLWLIASETNGELPANNKLAFRLRIKETQLIQILEGLSHYLEHDASTVLSPCLQHACLETETYREEAYREETEGEEELEGARVRQPATRPTRLSADWQPPHEELVWVAAAFPRLDAKAETEKFRDHFLANGKVMAKWHHAWRNWMRRAITYQSNAAAKPKGFLDRYAEEIEETRALEQQEEMRHVRKLNS